MIVDTHTYFFTIPLNNLDDPSVLFHVQFSSLIKIHTSLYFFEIDTGNVRTDRNYLGMRPGREVWFALQGTSINSDTDE